MVLNLGIAKLVMLKYGSRMTTATDTVTAGAATGTATWYRRLAATGHWLRDTGLGVFGVALLLLVATAGWGGSTLGLRDFAQAHMGYEGFAAWLVPATFDGASVGLTIAAFRAAIHGRRAPITRIGIVAFTALSFWMNYEHIDDPIGRRIAALLPVAAVALLEALLAEGRRAHSRRHGRQQRQGMHPLRLLFDWSGTWAIFRAIVVEDPLPAAGTATPGGAATVKGPVAPDTDTSTSAALPATAATDTAGTATVTPINQVPRPRSAIPPGGKAAAMLARFNQAVEEGRVDALSGASLANGIANESIGRKYLREWKAELATNATSTNEASG